MNTSRRNKRNLNRRRAQRNKRVFTSIAVMFVITLIVVTTVYLNNVDANSSGNSTPKYKYYKSYQIQPGDTLTTIAEEYTKNTNISVDEYIKEVSKNNNLISDDINSGNYLYIAYYSDTRIK